MENPALLRALGYAASMLTLERVSRVYSGTNDIIDKAPKEVFDKSKKEYNETVDGWNEMTSYLLRSPHF